MITYNHEKFIAQALEGILMQKVNFAYDIVIGEDCSKDKTREIILEYVKKDPSKFKLLLHDQNVGAMANQTEVMKACTGKYIAMCEGDDYWTDPLKLQKQIDFLENHKDFTVCYHDVEILTENPAVRENSQIKYKRDRDEYIFDDLIDEGNLMHTPSVVFRRLENYPSINAITADYFLNMHNAFYGRIKRLEGIWACYRVHGDGNFSQRKNWPMSKKIYNSVVQISAYKQAKKMYATSRKRKRLFNNIIFIEYNRQRFYFIEEADKKQIRRISFKLLRLVPGTKFFNLKTIMSVIVSIISPLWFCKSHRKLDLNH